MIRDNKDNKGININNKEFKLLQYADDTQLLLDGSEISLKKALRTLKQYYIMSGLKKMAFSDLKNVPFRYILIHNSCNLWGIELKLEILACYLTKNMWNKYYYSVMHFALF